MNRRSFLSSLLAGVVAPAFLPGAGRKWIAHTGSELLVPKRAVINPAYANAPFEVRIFWHKEAYTCILEENGTLISEPPSEAKLIDDTWPVRFNSIEDYHNKKRIPPFMLV